MFDITYEEKLNKALQESIEADKVYGVNTKGFSSRSFKDGYKACYKDFVDFDGSLTNILIEKNDIGGYRVSVSDPKFPLIMSSGPKESLENNVISVLRNYLALSSSDKKSS